MSVTRSERMLDLMAQLAYHAYLYYVKNTPEISDKEYDTLYKELQELEAQDPDNIFSYSPTQRVGAIANSKLAPIAHKVPMLSLDNTYNSEETEAFLNKTREQLGHTEGLSFMCELKLDGVGVALFYNHGVLQWGATRGDGHIGEDVTHTARTIRSIPLVIDFKGAVEIRGEVVMRKSVFERINATRDEPFVNPRNAAAGTIRQLDPSEASKRSLDFFAYQVINRDDSDSSTAVSSIKDQVGTFQFLISQSFQLEDNFHKVFTADELDKYYNSMLTIRDKLDYEVDGIVIKVNYFKPREQLGTTSSRPKWAMAYKFPAKQATTVVKSVTLQVGRTGTITPVAELEPVFLAGAVIRRATLHNFDEVERLDIRVGDTVLIERAGDVIPKIRQVIVSKRNGTEQCIHRPNICPVCCMIVYSSDDEVAIYCINPNCPAKLIDNLRHFVGRDSMDIEGLGVETLCKLVEAGKVKDPADLYFLTPDDFSGMDGIGDKTIHNILTAIENSKSSGLARVIHTLGIPKVGKSLGNSLVKHFPSMDSLVNATQEELESIDGIGSIVAANIVKCLQQPHYRTLIDKYRQAFLLLTVDMVPDDTLSAAPKVLDGKRFVITGTLSKPRSEIQVMIEDSGGRVSGSVSKNTDYLVAGEKTGSKLTKAEKLGISIITEEELCELLQKDIPLL